MSLIKRQTLIGFCCAAALLDLDQTTIRKGLCGTDNLTQIRRGGRISLILEEVIELRSEWISAEISKKQRTLDRQPKRLSLAG